MAVGLLIGCSTSGRKVEQTQVDTIRVGNTREDVRALIGTPENVAKSSTGETWTYNYRRSSPNAKRFIPLLGHFIGGKNVETQEVVITFDEGGQVVDVQTAYGGKDAQGRSIPETVEGSAQN